MTGTEEARIAAWLDQQAQLVGQHIRESGVHLEYVIGDFEAARTSLCYTIGLFGVGHPELLVTGLNMHNAQGLLNDLARQVYEGRQLVPGEVVAFEHWQHRVFVEESPNPGEIVFAANLHYQRPAEYSVPVLQLTTDDILGNFPWDPGYSVDAWRQPRPGTFDAYFRE
jgi:hypothetical protein